MLIKRVVTGSTLVGITVLSILFLDGIWIGLVFGVVWSLGLSEWAGFARLEKGATVTFVVIVLLLMGSLGLPDLPPVAIWSTLGVSLLWWLIALAFLFRYPRPLPASFVLSAGVATLLPTWILLSFLHGRPDGKQLILTVLIIVWAADIGAYVVGRSLGRHKLAPQISPGKTWEGVLGGLGFAMLAGYVASLPQALTAAQLIALGLATAVASIIGDLTVSMFKRNVGLKDSGSTLPGHGGVLDRMDSLTSATTVFVLGVMIIAAGG